MWVAKKRILIHRGKGHVWLNPGDPVPEAAGWRNVKAIARQGKIEWIEDPIPESESNRPILKLKAEKAQSKKTETKPETKPLAKTKAAANTTKPKTTKKTTKKRTRK